MTRARFAFSAHPDAIADLRELPDGIRDQALLHLQDLVHGERVAKRLEGRLDGYHKVFLGTGNEFASHRLIVQFRDAPPDSAHSREVYLVAAGARKDYAVYRAAHLRTSPEQATEARMQAAVARSPHATAQAPALPAAPPTATTPAASASDSRRVPQR